LDQVQAHNRGLSREWRQEKYDLVAASAAAFFRGTDHLYWADFGRSPLLEAWGGRKLRTWLTGDLHTYNLGAFDDAQGRVVYGPNDFDEAVIGDYQLDLWRLGAGVALRAREQGGPGGAEALVAALLKGYLDELAACAARPARALEPWTRHQAQGELRLFLEHAEAHGGGRAQLEKWVDAVRQFRTDRPELLAAVPARRQEGLRQGLKAYAARLAAKGGAVAGRCKVRSLAARLRAGIGSHGSERYYALIEASGPAPATLLDIKRQAPPAPWAHLQGWAKEATREAMRGDHGRRVAKAQRALLPGGDPWLGRLSVGKAAFSVRRRSPYKAAFDRPLDGGTASQMGLVVARAQARARAKFAPQAHRRLHGGHPAFIAFVSRLALAYADQVELDHRAFADARPGLTG
jgi:uncharacterized protein (DUF2252 family)